MLMGVGHCVIAMDKVAMAKYVQELMYLSGSELPSSPDTILLASVSRLWARPSCSSVPWELLPNSSALNLCIQLYMQP